MMSHSFEWLSKLEEAVDKLKIVPLWGHTLDIPLEKIAKTLCGRLGIKEMKISLGQAKSVAFHNFLSGMGENPMQLSLYLTPLSELFFWVISKESVAQLTRAMLSDSQNPEGVSDPDLQEGYFRYLCLETIDVLTSLRCFEELSLHIGAAAPLPEEGALCLDMTISFKENSFPARLICPAHFLESFKNYFAVKKKSLYSYARRVDVPLELSLTIGGTKLTAQEVARLEEGDFLFLDRCTYDPETKRGKGEFTIDGKPLFDALLEREEIKVQDYITYERVH
jgi:hypothetical protein